MPVMRIRSSWVALTGLGATYALFCLLLYRAGVPGRASLLPIDPAAYYLAQALFVGPLFVLLALIFAAAIRGIGAPAREPGLPETFHAFAPLYAWPILLLFVVPDLVVFLFYGHGALASAMKFYAPLVPLTIGTLAARRARTVWGIGRGRAAIAAIAGLAAQAAVGGLLLR